MRMCIKSEGLYRFQFLSDKNHHRLDNDAYFSPFWKSSSGLGGGEVCKQSQLIRVGFVIFDASSIRVSDFIGPIIFE